MYLLASRNDLWKQLRSGSEFLEVNINQQHPYGYNITVTS